MANTIKRSIAPNAVFESATLLTDATISYDQGDLLCVNPSGLIGPITVDAVDCLTFLGVAREKVVLGKLKRPYTTAVDASQAANEIPGPIFGVEALLVSKTGDAWTTGALVYLNVATNAGRGVSVAGGLGDKPIGVYVGPAIASATAGQEILVRIGHTFPIGELSL